MTYKKNAFRRTKIIATLGPATNSPEMLEELILAGLDVARINMTHSDHEQATSLIATVREIAARLNRVVAIIMDLQGPAIRTGDLKVDFDLKPGELIVLSVRGETSEEHRSVDVNYDQLVDDIKVDDIVIVDNGEIRLKVLEKRRNQLHCEVLNEGTLGSRRHINLPGVRVNLPALTEKDIVDVELGVNLEVDYIAMSFVREADDVKRLKSILDYKKSPIRVIAKLEDQEAIRNLNSIIEVSDAIMVARGDLGIEIPYEELPIVQRRIVKACVIKGRPVIVATHMLESMIDSPHPTRAEITDVANAVFEQADAIMLSGETSIGKFPRECITVMDRIAHRIESSGGAGYAKEADLADKGQQVTKAAVVMASETNAEALIVFTKNGGMGRNAARLRPLETPIFAFTDDERTLGRLALLWGVRPFLMPIVEDASTNVEGAIKILREANLLKSGDNIVAVTELTTRGKIVDSIQMEVVD
ncbi:MAG: pyruvate kinase [Candidatus Promineifilaceae bacterium]|jgi:pyruvate kinase